ncbi:MAG: stage III sporulation protein AB [Clostridia bacterium]|nr:stage III sporulation protein AB [Clostridia bacterium]
MMRAISAILLFTACFLYGNSLNRNAQIRPKLIELLAMDIRRIKSNMEYTRAPVTRLLSMEALKLQVWNGVCSLMDEGKTLSEAWAEERAKAAFELCELSSDEKGLLDEFMSFLGESALDGQLKRMEDIASKLDRLHLEIKPECTRRGKLARTLMLLLGLCLAVLLM